jgi:hypothetical protein
MCGSFFESTSRPGPLTSNLGLRPGARAVSSSWTRLRAAGTEIGRHDEQRAEMPIPDLERARVGRALDKFCDRVPAAIRSELKYEYRIRGNTVVLVERRPHFRDRTRYTEHPFAKFVYGPTVGGWSLRWSDRNGRWHAYQGFRDVPHFRALREVEADPTGIFLG